MVPKGLIKNLVCSLTFYLVISQVPYCNPISTLMSPLFQVKCPKIDAIQGLQVSSNNRGLNHRVTFECTNGNSLIGASQGNIE